MIGRRITTVCAASALALSTATTAFADGGDVVGGIIGGIIGGAIVNGANQNRRTTTTRTVRVPSATRAANAEVQTSLNYFGFPAGTPDGVFGRNSRNAIAQYQVYMSWPATGQLNQFERDFLVTSYQRAIAGGALTAQQIAANPQGVRGLLVTYRDQAYGAPAPFAQPQTPQTTVVVVPQQAEPLPAAPAPVSAATPAAPALPNFLGGAATQASLASHCNQVSLVTNSNGGYVTRASMSDPDRALNEQFCLARTYAIATGEDLATRVPGTTPQQIAAQCEAFGPALREHVAAVSLKAPEQVLAGVGSFALSTGMAPAQLAGTATICLSSGYRTDDMEVAIGSALLLVALGEQPYAELIGHHLIQGFGTSRRADLAGAWFDIGLAALDQGAPAVFNPGQGDRVELLRAALGLPGQAAIAVPTVTPAAAVPAATPAAGALPSFVVTKEMPSK